VNLSPKQRLQDLEDVFSALAHASRRQILLTVHFWGGAMSAGDIAARFGHSWPTTTRHLRLLTDAGLLIQERRGRARLYRLNSTRLAVASEWLDWFKATPAAAAEASLQAAAGEARAVTAGRRRA
jgi:DNA-binding transcriptional ArsR family regulator